MLLFIPAGLLEAPSNLIVLQENETHINITWESPPTLDLTDIEQDIHQYTVYIANRSTNWTDRITETGYSLPIGVDDCNYYTFSVSASNKVGEGNRSDPIGIHVDTY